MNRSLRPVVVTLISVFVLVVWYVIASGYDYSDLAGTYAYEKDGISCLLILGSDGTFHQELRDVNGPHLANGSWRRIGEGGATFSGEFLRLPGQQSYSDRFGPDPNSATNADFGGHFYKILAVYPELDFDGFPTDIRLHKKLFR
jgi:hypothetical protein